MSLADLFNLLGLLVTSAAAVAVAVNKNTQGLVSAFFKGFNGALKAETLQG